MNLFANDEVESVSFRGDASSEQWGPWRPLWDQLDMLVRHEIEPRLLERTTRQVSVGSHAEIVSLRAKGRGIFTVTAESLQARKMFTKPIPWKAITEMPGVDQIITTDPEGKRSKHNTGLSSSEWDAWQLPFLWHHFGVPACRQGCPPVLQGSNATTAAPVAPIVAVSGEPGMVSGRCSGAVSRTRTVWVAAIRDDHGLEAGVRRVRAGPLEVGLHGSAGLGRGDREPVVADAAGVDVGAGGAEVGARQRGTVGEGVEPLALQIGGRRVGHHGDAHRQHARQADDHHGRLPRLGSAGHGTAPGSWYCPIGTSCRALSAKVAPPPRRSGMNGRATLDVIRTVTTAPPV